MNTYIKDVEFYKGVTIIRLIGNIKLANLKSVQDEYREKMKDRTVKNILFDLKEVDDVDSSGLAVLVDLLRYMKTHQAGDEIGLINVSQKMKDLLSISKTEKIFHEYPSEEIAINELK